MSNELERLKTEMIAAEVEIELLKSKQCVVDVIKDRAMQKMDNFDDCSDELAYLSTLDNDAYSEVKQRYDIVKNTTGFQIESLKHKIKIFIRNVVN